jgi:hypothetical protein
LEKNVIIGEPREPKKGKKVLDLEVVLEKSNDNQRALRSLSNLLGSGDKPKLLRTSIN